MYSNIHFNFTGCANFQAINGVDLSIVIQNDDNGAKT